MPGYLPLPYTAHSVALRNLISSPKGSLEAICGGAGVAPRPSWLISIPTYLHALLCDLSVHIQGAFRVSFSLQDITEYVEVRDDAFLMSYFALIIIVSDIFQFYRNKFCMNATRLCESRRATPCAIPSDCPLLPNGSSFGI